MADSETGHETPRRSGVGRRSLIVLIISAVVVVALVVGAYVISQGGLGTGPGANDGEAASFNGEGDTTTDSFTVSEGWRIRWQTQADNFEMALSHDGSTRTLYTREGPGSGTTEPRGSGTFQLVVTADGPWSIVVEQP